MIFYEDQPGSMIFKQDQLGDTTFCEGQGVWLEKTPREQSRGIFHARYWLVTVSVAGQGHGSFCAGYFNSKVTVTCTL
ncbi:hypothetical protein NKI38_10905 [Mesorhizobium sp. M0621]|uniref:hypothetical protein n=1 Tax=Mesorhizobium sp. M0621 TaxID=2956974 RepID=UPI00333601DD